MTPNLSRLAGAYVFFIGACLGSFLNVVIARVPAGRSVISPGSSCPRCGKLIAWYDNLPVLSWLLLRARCRNCELPISARYPIVELLTAFLLFAIWRRFGAVPAALGYGAFTCALIALTYIDIDTWLLPHEITWPLLAVGLVSPLWNADLTWPAAGIGAAAGFAAFAAIALVGEKLLHKETMGWGDVWLLAGIGAWLGWQALLPVVVLSSLQGALVGIVLLVAGRGPAEKARAEREAAIAAGTRNAPDPMGAGPADAHRPVDARGAEGTLGPEDALGPPSDEEDWIPPPHAVPFGPFLALAALEVLLAQDAIFGFYFSVVQKMFS